MRKLIVIIGLLFGASAMYAQQLPHFTNFMAAHQYVNPSSMLNQRYKQVLVNSSLAATGFDDSPHSYYLGYIHPLGQGRREDASFSIGQVRSDGNTKNALGAYLLYDHYGLINQTSFMVSYAQKFKLSSNTFIGLGISTGLYHFAYDYNGLTIENSRDETYLDYINSNLKLLYWDANFGMQVRHKDYKLEASVRQLLRDRAKLSNTDLNSSLQEQFAFRLSSKHTLNSFLTLIPSIAFEKQYALPAYAALSTQFVLQDRWLASLHYNHQRNLGLEFGMIYSSFVLNYTFHLNTNHFSVLGYTNHEISLRYIINSGRHLRFTDLY